MLQRLNPWLLKREPHNTHSLKINKYPSPPSATPLNKSKSSIQTQSKSYVWRLHQLSRNYMGMHALTFFKALIKIRPKLVFAKFIFVLILKIIYQNIEKMKKPSTLLHVTCSKILTKLRFKYGLLSALLNFFGHHPVGNW